MKRLMLSLVMMSLTFASGVGIDRLFWHLESNMIEKDTVNPVPLAVVETIVRQPPVDPPAPPPAPAPPILNYSSKVHAADGAYYWMGPRPKAFAEFRSLDLLTQSTPTDQPPGYMAWIYAEANNDYYNPPAVFGVITDTRLFIVFTQTSELDFEYRLEGEFVRTDFESVANKDKAVIRGTITKYRDGKKVAESSVSFRLEILGC